MTEFIIQPDGSDGLDAPLVSDPYDDINYGNQTFMFLGSVFALGSTVLQRGLLRFDLSQLPTSPVIASALLTIYSDGSGDTPGVSTFTAKRLTRLTWLEAQATWNSYITGSAWTTAGGDATATNQATSTASGDSTELTFDVTAMLRDALAAGLTALHVLLSGPETPGVTNYYAGLTSETSTAAERPRLAIVTQPEGVVDGAAALRSGLLGAVAIRPAAVGRVLITPGVAA